MKEIIEEYGEGLLYLLLGMIISSFFIEVLKVVCSL